jgi:hypothetical protein
VLKPTPFPAACVATVGDNADHLVVARELREIGDDQGELETGGRSEFDARRQTRR